MPSGWRALRLPAATAAAAAVAPTPAPAWYQLIPSDDRHASSNGTVRVVVTPTHPPPPPVVNVSLPPTRSTSCTGTEDVGVGASGRATTAWPLLPPHGAAASTRHQAPKDLVLLCQTSLRSKSTLLLLPLPPRSSNTPPPPPSSTTAWPSRGIQVASSVDAAHEAPASSLRHTSFRTDPSATWPPVRTRVPSAVAITQ